ncbi:hypothetical protein [Bdellovibrio sp. ArHS]|uniref:hypothetical protein n=1 Tax=Bdellovibrio sp. ArHS TaxID=1569284 RepID=UPI000A7EFFC7|nr:hypothetical protein [Bdellovibrio sp. ArHS]
MFIKYKQIPINSSMIRLLDFIYNLEILFGIIFISSMVILGYVIHDRKARRKKRII